jgi:hypothetical protein
VRFLRVLGLGGVFAWARRHVGVAVILGDDLARRGDGLRREVDAVGAHIGNEAGRAVADIDALVQALRDLHGARRRKAELAGRFLLQGRGGEGRNSGWRLTGFDSIACDREARLAPARS